MLRDLGDLEKSSKLQKCCYEIMHCDCGLLKPYLKFCRSLCLLPCPYCHFKPCCEGRFCVACCCADCSEESFSNCIKKCLFTPCLWYLLLCPCSDKNLCKKLGKEIKNSFNGDEKDEEIEDSCNGHEEANSNEEEEGED